MHDGRYLTLTMVNIMTRGEFLIQFKTIQRVMNRTHIVGNIKSNLEIKTDQYAPIEHPQGERCGEIRHHDVQ